MNFPPPFPLFRITRWNEKASSSPLPRGGCFLFFFLLPFFVEHYRRLIKRPLPPLPTAGSGRPFPFFSPPA